MHNAQESIWDDARQEAECARVRRLIAINRFKRWAKQMVQDLAFFAIVGGWAVLVGASFAFALLAAGVGR
jgi:hypothetical protein